MLFAAKATSLIEQMATNYLTRRAAGSALAEDATDADQASLDRLERRAIVLACLSGAISGTILAAVEIAIHRQLGDELAIGAWREQLSHWAGFLGATLVVSTAEIVFLYWIALRTAAHYLVAAGRQPLPDPLHDLRVRSIARAALELPEPREPVRGLDPYSRLPWWKHWAGVVLYRLKVGTTNVVLRALVRRILGRAAVRFFVPLAAIPVFVVWNGLITWWAVRQARLRAFGVVPIRELSARLRTRRHELSDDARTVIVSALGEALLRNEGPHPNLVLLIQQLVEALDVHADRIEANWSVVRGRCHGLHDHEQQVLLEALALAMALTGRVRRAQRDLLDEAAVACGRRLEPHAVRVQASGLRL